MPNVSSRWPSKLGGSAAPTKTSSPPERGLSWAGAGPAVAKTATTAKEVRIISDRLARCPMGTSERGEKVPRTISHARTRTPRRTSHRSVHVARHSASPSRYVLTHRRTHRTVARHSATARRVHAVYRSSNALSHQYSHPVVARPGELAGRTADFRARAGHLLSLRCRGTADRRRRPWDGHGRLRLRCRRQSAVHHALRRHGRPDRRFQSWAGSRRYHGHNLGRGLQRYAEPEHGALQRDAGHGECGERHAAHRPR